MRWKIALAFFAVYVCWGMTYLAMRVAVMEIPPHLLSGTRFVLAGVLLYVWARLRGHAAPTLKHWRAATVIGGFLLLGGNASVAWAEKTVPSGLAAVLIAVAPIWMVGLEWARGGPRPTRVVIIGLLLGLAGVALLVSGRGSAESRVDPVGAAILVLASASWAWGSVVSKTAALPKSPFMATSIEMIAGGALLLLTAALSGQFSGFDVSRLSFEAVAWWGYLVVFGSLVGFTAYIWLLGVTSIAKAGTYAYVNPIVAVLMGWAVLHEPVTMRMLIAAGVILVGVALVNVDWSSTGLLALIPDRLRPSRAP
ncbi:MAG TPA: EamA family transporter [Gemmatimonadales bacterium]|nr:EamA family transporter [Gemmatimonadales bacterium]